MVRLVSKLAPVGVVSSSFTWPPEIAMFESLKISKIALAGLEVVPCENVKFPPPTATGVVTISSSNNFKSSRATAVPTISITVSILETS